MLRGDEIVQDGGDDLLQEGMGEFSNGAKDANFVAEGFVDALLSRCNSVQEHNNSTSL